MGVYGNGTNQWHRDLIGRNLLESEKREAMGINWATHKGLAEAIPPAYAKHIGDYAMMALGCPVGRYEDSTNG